MLGEERSLADLGAQILPQLYGCELRYLCREEFARTSEDILWRRSKLGLHLQEADLTPLEHWLQSQAAGSSHEAQTLPGGI